jgi:hypothetical protein
MPKVHAPGRLTARIMRHTAKRGAPEDMGDFGPLDLSDVDFRDLLDAEERKHIGSPAAKEEKRAISEVAVMKGLPAGITRNIGKFLGKSAKGGRRKTRRRTGGRRKTRRFRR